MLRPIETPKANPENLLAIMRDAYDGKVVIPEFQRSFVWGREDIEEFLVSILQGYFIGTFLILDTPTERPMFPFRTVEGLEQVNPRVTPHNHSTVRLVLDGQQRVSSLFYVLYEPSLALKNTKNPYRFFFQLDLALDADPEDAVRGVSQADRRRMGEMEKLVQEDRAIPFPRLRDASGFYRWLYHEQKFLTKDEDKALIEAFYHRFQNLMVPVVALSPEAGKDNVINIFERINRMGVKLSLFDLAVARLYPKQVRLRELWEEFTQANSDPVEVLKPEFLLKIIALWQGKEPRKGTLLDVIDSLQKTEFERAWERACAYAIKAYDRTTNPSGGYGAYQSTWIPYSTMIVPLAVLLEATEKRKAGELTYRKIDKWYWGNVFSQRYDSAVDTKSHGDVKDFLGWADGGDPPQWYRNLSVGGVNLNVDEPRSAVYRGLMCLVVTRGARDFRDGQVANLKVCEDDHIFPHSKYSKHPSVNSILNRTLISPASNKIKGDKKPSEYLPLFLREHGGDEGAFRTTLASHFINEDGLEAMRQDDIDGFLQARGREFTSCIQSLLS